MYTHTPITKITLKGKKPSFSTTKVVIRKDIKIFIIVSIKNVIMCVYAHLCTPNKAERQRTLEYKT